MADVADFIYVGIYWGNHHHLLHACKRVTGSMLWATLHLLFRLSLLPFATSANRWMDDDHTEALPNAACGLVLRASAVVPRLLQQRIITADGQNLTRCRMPGSNRKGKTPALLYLTGIGLSLVQVHLAQLTYALLALIWLPTPDRRIECHQQRAPPAGRPLTGTATQRPACAGLC